MAKKKKAEDSYVKEMRIWIEQHRQRLKSCEASMAECGDQIVIVKELQRLEQAQARIITKRITAGEKTLADYLAK